MRVRIVAAGSALLFAVIAVAFWYADIRYSLPTPRPPDLHQAPLGTTIAVDQWLVEAGFDPPKRPVLVHFFNPDCPCSRFNVDHLRTLHARFGDRVFFVAAVQSNRSKAEIDDKMRALRLEIPYFIDVDGRRAGEVGVYSTPQAALVDATGRLVYRGNYNTSRYCTDPRTEFVRIALEHLLANDPAASTPELPAYGCKLPSTELALKPISAR